MFTIHTKTHFYDNFFLLLFQLGCVCVCESKFFIYEILVFVINRKGKNVITKSLISLYDARRHIYIQCESNRIDSSILLEKNLIG